MNSSTPSQIIINKLNQSYKDNNILHKELHHIKSEYGELLLRDSDNSRRLTELLSESAELRSEVRRLTQEAELRSRELSELREENRLLREGYETGKMETERIIKENRKLKLEKEVIFEAANVKFKRFEQRVVVLERNLAAIKRFTLGEQRETLDNAHSAQETIASLGSDKLGPKGMKTTVGVAAPSEQNSASSISGPKGVSRVPVKEQLSFGCSRKLEGLVRCQTGYKTMPPIVEKTGSSKPFTDIKTTSTLPICISDSDDEDEPKGIKRKLDFAGASGNFQTPVTVPKPCEKNGSGLSTKQWECEVQMLAELEKNIELCLKSVCVLYKQHTTVGKPRGFRDIDAFWGMVLGKFLVDGDEHGRLKKSAAELKDYSTEGPSKCRSIAISHSSQLFDIYKNKEDPHFSSPN